MMEIYMQARHHWQGQRPPLAFPLRAMGLVISGLDRQLRFDDLKIFRADRGRGGENGSIKSQPLGRMERRLIDGSITHSQERKVTRPAVKR